ncbi:hypothetical protein ACFMQL_38970 [Nonomuraea fastidiosa]|jgi:hypothetical protein|uniref:hypothetical protein n=1 Tax=Nonomuraea TaxID=83681 RepID=UPI00324B96DC
MNLAARTMTTGLAALACLFASAPAPAWSAAPEGNAPMCVAVWQTTGRFTKTGFARNDCKTRLRLKIMWGRGMDGDCQTVDPGKTISSQVFRGVRSFDGANTC